MQTKWMNGNGMNEQYQRIGQQRLQIDAVCIIYATHWWIVCACGWLVAWLVSWFMAFLFFFVLLKSRNSLKPYPNNCWIFLPLVVPSNKLRWNALRGRTTKHIFAWTLTDDRCFVLFVCLCRHFFTRCVFICKHLMKSFAQLKTKSHALTSLFKQESKQTAILNFVQSTRVLSKWRPNETNEVNENPEN